MELINSLKNEELYSVMPTNCHPIYTGSYLIPTNEISRLYQLVSRCINNRCPGALIFGKPRLGKTRAINFLVSLLPQEYVNIPIYHMTCREYSKPNENIFFEDLLRTVGHPEFNKGKANNKRDRLLKYLVQKVNISGQNRLLLFIDDAQRLHEMQYNWLMDLYNELDYHKIFLTVFLVGQEELENHRSVFFELGKKQIIGRFMVEQYQFRGIETTEDLQEILKGYDFYSEYPENSGISFTRCFFNHVKDYNFTLQSSTNNLFKVFEDLRKEAAIRTKIEIPMQYLALTIEYALKEFGINGQAVNILTAKHWFEAINESGYISAELYSNRG